MNNLYKSLIIVFLLLFIGVAYYNYKTNTYVTAEFKNLRPFHDRAPIYYNGFKIGKVVKVRPNDDYTSTILTLELHPNKLRLPINIVANLKKEKDRKNHKYDYIDIIYPDAPSVFFIKDGDKIAGKTTVELDTYLSNQDPESLDAIKADMADSVKNLNITIQALGDLFSTLNSMAEEVKPNVVSSSQNINKASAEVVKISGNINTVTGNVNDAFDGKSMDSTAVNIQATTKNVKVLSSELNRTLPQIQCSINEVNRILCNIDEMTEGLNCTMKKPFGGFRLIFGSPVSKRKYNCR